MFRDEEDLKQSDGVLVCGAESSPGRHIASALMRLGYRTFLQLQSTLDLKSLEPLSTEVLRSEGKLPNAQEIQQSRPFRTAVISPSAQLSGREEVSSAFTMELQGCLSALQNFDSEIRSIVLIPDSIKAVDFQQLVLKNPSTQFIACPVVIGFRDRNIMDEVVKSFSKAYKLRAESDPNNPRPIAFASDAAAAVVSLIAERKRSSHPNPIRLIPNLPGLFSLLEAFNEIELPKPKQGFLAKFFPPVIDIGRQLSPISPESLNKSELFDALTLSIDRFPNPPTTAARFIKQARELYDRDPGLGLHFPPSRAL